MVCGRDLRPGVVRSTSWSIGYLVWLIDKTWRDAIRECLWEMFLSGYYLLHMLHVYTALWLMIELSRDCTLW